MLLLNPPAIHETPVRLSVCPSVRLSVAHLLVAVLLLPLITARAQNFPASDPVYSGGNTTWNAEPGFLYRISHSRDMATWRLMPDRWYGYGQQISVPLHASLAPPPPLNAEPPPGPAINPPALPAPASTTSQAVEVILSQTNALQINGQEKEVDIPLSVQVRNRGAAPLVNVQVNLPLASAFADLITAQAPFPAAAAASILVEPFNKSGDGLLALTLNPGFNGGTDTRLLAGTDTLPVIPGLAGDHSIAAPQAHIQLTVRLTFISARSFPRTSRYLYAAASGGGTTPNAGVTVNASGSYTNPGLPACCPSSSDYVWPWGSSTASATQRVTRGVTPVNIFDQTQRFYRTVSARPFNNGHSLLTWTAPDGSLVQHYMALNLAKTCGGYYNGIVDLKFSYPSQAAGVEPPPSLPLFASPTRIDFSIWAFGSLVPVAPTPEEMAKSAPASEFLAKEVLRLQKSVILEKLATPSPPSMPYVPPSGSISLTDRDLAEKQRGYWRIDRFRYDSNCNGIYDDVELHTNPEWQTNFDTNSNKVPDGYETALFPNTPPGSAPLPANPGIIISEICAENAGNLKDGAGDTPDWIELVNVATTCQKLAGLRLKDSGTGADEDKWFTFPKETPDLASGEHVVVMCNGATPTVALPYTAAFGINLKGERITLDRPIPNSENSEVLDFLVSGFPANYTSQFADITFGRWLDPEHPAGVSPVRWGYLKPTPGSLNSVGRTLQLDPPIVKMFDSVSDSEVTRGVYSRNEHATLRLEIIPIAPEQMVVMALDPRITLHFTTNGSVPTEWSPVWDPANPPFFDRTVVIRAVATAEGCFPSVPTTGTWIFKESIVGGSAGDPPLLPGTAPIVVQTKPAGYPEFSLPEANSGAPNGYPMAYAASATVAGDPARRAAIMTGLSAVPTISITAPPRLIFDREAGGNYACSLNTPLTNADPESTSWERDVSVEWLAEGNAPVSGGSLVLARLSLSGATNLSWNRTEKHSLTLNFGDIPGTKKFGTNLAVFPEYTDEKNYDSLILRNPTFDSWTMMIGDSAADPRTNTYAKDAWARALMTNLGFPQLNHRWVHVYLNGLYWGVYMLTEKANEDTMQRKLGTGNYYVWKDGKGDVIGDNEAVNGQPTPSASWAELIAATEAVYTKAGAVPPQNASVEYAAVETLMDIPCFISYTLMHACIGNFDALRNNGRAYKAVPGGKIKWLAYDVEVGVNDLNLNQDCFNRWWTYETDIPGRKRGEAGTESRILSNLSHHPRFAQAFGDIAFRLCFIPPQFQSGAEAGRLSGAVVAGANPSSGRAQTDFLAAASLFNPLALCESVRWGVGIRGTYATAPTLNTSPGLNYALGLSGTTPAAPTGGFFAARSAIFKQQLINRGLYSTVPVPEVTPGPAPDTWVLSSPSMNGCLTYWSRNFGYEPDGPGTSVSGNSLPAGLSVVLSGAGPLRARVLAPHAASGDDTPYWSVMFEVNLPSHP